MKVCLDLDDFTIRNNRLDLLLQLKEHYPNLKVSLFTIPLDIYQETSVQERVWKDKRLEKIKEHTDWLQFIPHGLAHIQNEFLNCDYYTMRDLVIPSIDEAFTQLGLKYEKGFKAPYWMWNEQVIRALDEQGWWGAIDRNQPQMLKTKKTYTYNYSIHEPFWKYPEEILKLHGHIDGVSDNDLELCLPNLMKIPQEAEWVFITDFVE